MLIIGLNSQSNPQRQQHTLPGLGVGYDAMWLRGKASAAPLISEWILVLLHSCFLALLLVRIENSHRPPATFYVTTAL